jgi:tetratricopeptide (TPR) repeat protein
VKRNTGPLPLSIRAPTAGAAEAFGRALEQLLRATGDPLGEIQPVLSEHPTFVMGHLLRAAIAVLAKDASALPLLAAALSAAGRAGGGVTDHERRHFAAACAWLSGEPELAAERYASMVRDAPRDLLALRLAQSCYFFVGQTPALRDVADLAAPGWTRGMPGLEYVLAMTAFGYAENGDTERAERLGRCAVEIRPKFPFAIHAVAHALYERGDHAGGKLWMRQHETQWLTDSRMVAHNAWHLAQFELESGEPARALAALDQRLIPSASMSASGAADATALLWRLQLDGVDPGSRWSALSDCWTTQSWPGFWPFLDLYAAIAFNAADHFDRANRLARAVAVCARADNLRARLSQTVTLPGLHAIEAFAVGAFANACVALRTLRPALRRVGASHAQVSLFGRMLVEAERRCRPPARRAVIPALRLSVSA